MAKKVKPKVSTGLNLQPNQNSTGSLIIGASSSTTATFMNGSLFTVNGTNQIPIFSANANGSLTVGDKTIFPDIMFDYFKYILAVLDIEIEYTYEDFVKLGKGGYEAIIRDVKLKKLIDKN